MKQTVIGLFNKSSEAQQAVKQLISDGFSNSNIDLSIGSTANDGTTGSKDFNLDAKNDEHESGVTRFFKNLFGDSNENTNRYSNAASRGNSIVTVHAQSTDEAERAADVLDSNGAINVDEDADGYDNYDTNTGASPVGAFNETAGASAATPDAFTTQGAFDDAKEKASFNDADELTDKTSIPVIEENMQVGKRTVETGGVRLRSRIVESPVEENLRLREERVYVNRTPVNRTATSADFDTFNEGEIELREHAEVPVISKEAHVVEEVTLGKETNERNETIRDTVRKTEVDVENLNEDKSNLRTSSGEIKRDN